MSNLFRKKSIELIQRDAAAGLSDHEGGTGLRRTLGGVDLTGLGIAAIIGAGIFAMIGNASFNGGPAVVFLFILTAFACAFSALCYAEFISQTDSRPVITTITTAPNASPTTTRRCFI